MAENKNEEVKGAAIAQETSPVEELLKKNFKVFAGGLTALVIVLVGVYFYMTSSEKGELNADLDLYRAEYWFAKDSLDLALEGDGDEVIGFEDVASDHSGTDAGNLANLYAGIAYMNKGDFDAAIGSLEKFSSSDLIFQARAYSLIGDANMELENYEAAVSNYKKAVEEKPNKVYTPTYIMKLALAYELTEKKQEALKCYSDLIEKYPTANALVKDAKKYKGKLESELN